MLEKDQYNQEDYNNYYKQESEGAEIKGYAGDESNLKGKIFILLGLIGLAVAGYFGLKMFNNTDMPTKEKIAVNTDTPISEQITISEKTEEKRAVETEVEVKEESIQAAIATEIQERADGNKEMTEKDISKIVELVMHKMENTQPEENKEDTNDALMSALQETDTDTAPAKVLPIEEHTTTRLVEEKKEDSSSYNKVTVKETSDKDLNELSDQIKKLLNMAGEPTNMHKSSPTITSSIDKISTETGSTNYAKSISKEIVTRSKEMRIIVVRSGDTLNKIAKRAYGNSSSYQKIFDANPDILNRADRIYVGQKLRIPE